LLVAPAMALAIAALGGDMAGAASFDCRKASGYVETRICADDALSALDEIMARNYFGLRSANLGSAQDHLAQSQRAWLKRRNLCRDERCLDAAYRERIEALCTEYPVFSGAHPLAFGDCDLPQPSPDRGSGPGAEGARFADYPAHTVLSGGPKMPDFGGRDATYRTFRTRIGAAAAAGANFAGHFALVEVGCGTSCLTAFVVDLQTGQVGSFPHGGEAQYAMELAYGRDSRLLKARWVETVGGRVCVEQDMLAEGLTWRVIGERRTRLREPYCSGPWAARDD
jgi:uncharacterized protein